MVSEPRTERDTARLRRERPLPRRSMIVLREAFCREADAIEGGTARFVSFCFPCWEKKDLFCVVTQETAIHPFMSGDPKPPPMGSALPSPERNAL